MTIWVCVDCMLHHANGECGGCYEGHDEEPLSLLVGQEYAMGMRYSEHNEECPNNYPEGSDTTQASGMNDCDCEIVTYSTSRCEGCGSWLHGKRHAFTVFEPTVVRRLEKRALT